MTNETLVPGRDVRLPKPLIEELDMLLYQVKNEGMDLLFVIDGKEGIGKTSSEKAIGAYCAHKLGTPFGVPNVHYGTEEYMQSSEKMGRYTVHCLDEAGVILHRASSNTRVARRFTKYLQVAREGNNQVHIITLPAFHLLDGYLVNWRCKFVMNMYGEKVDDPNRPGGKRTKRGAFKVFPISQDLTESWNLHQALKIFTYPKQWYIHDRIPNCEVFTPEEEAELYAKKSKWRKEFVYDEDKLKDKPKVTADTPKQVREINRNVEVVKNAARRAGVPVGKAFIDDILGDMYGESHKYRILSEFKKTKGDAE